MRKQKWFKTAGVVAFAAQLVGVGGLANAAVTDNACFPQPTFVAGGDPKFDSLTADNLTRWTASSGFGWANGAGSEISYEGALTDNPNYTATGVPGHPEIGPQQLMFAFSRQVPIGSVDGAEGMRVGFNFSYKDHTGTTRQASQVLVVEFDAGGHTSTWQTNPTACTAGTAQGTECFNDPNGDPAQFIHFTPGYVQILKQTDDGKTDTWPASGTINQWVKDHSVVWIFGDTNATSGATQYWWRMQIELPIRRGASGATAPDPDVTDSWTSPSIYLDDTMFTASGKTTSPFWVDFITKFSDVAMVTYHPYPDSTSLKDPTQRTSNIYQVPSSTLWGTGELGSPRDPVLLPPGELHCSGSGITIETSTADKVVWHSDIWNKSAGVNSAGLFNDGGQLYMVDKTTGARAANVLAVQVKNTSGTNKPDRGALNAHFLVAPYGSQAVNTVWAPLTTGGNDYICKTGTGGATCDPIVQGAANVIDSAATATGTMNQGDTAELDLTGGGWIPSKNYVCAVQTTDVPNYSWYYEDPLEASICAGAVYKPTSKSGAVLNGAGLPGHQCMQVQLSSTSADVQFATKSAFRNMHQGQASLHRETATVDTRGLPKVKGQSYHDIYLYVETHNMPYRVDAGYSPRTYNTAMQIYNRSNGCDGEFCDPDNGWDPSVPAPSDNYFTKTMPTYIVHAYADTGARYKLNGRSVPVLQEMTSFGQFISHDSLTEGQVYGWDAGIEPVAGTQFSKVGPSTYRIRIPNDGAGQVITHVEPLPSKRPTCTGTVNMNIVQLLQSIAPLITVSPEDAGEINTLIDSLQIQCVDLAWFLDKIAAKDWGTWTSWVKFLVTQVEVASGCNCK